ncbi:MAG: hypothetical protein ACI9ON_000378 [Limisphaerales bacterium]|jgi:hypothetical protein
MLATAWAEAISARDVDTECALYAPEIVLIEGSSRLEGIEAVRAQRAVFYDVAEVFRITPIDFVTEQSTCVMRYDFYSRFGKDLAGFPTTGKESRVGGMARLSTQGGRITEVYDLFDSLRWARDLGIG